MSVKATLSKSLNMSNNHINRVIKDLTLDSMQKIFHTMLVKPQGFRIIAIFIFFCSFSHNLNTFLKTKKRKQIRKDKYLSRAQSSNTTKPQET